MTNYVLMILLILMAAFFGWAISAAGLGTKFNTVFGFLILAIIAAFGWNFYHKSTVLLGILLLVCFAALIYSLSYFVKKSPSVIHENENKGIIKSREKDQN